MKKKKEAKKIAFGTLKGGAAKTMNAFNIAGILAETSKVLIMDVDPQCNLTADCGIDIENREAVSTRYIFELLPSQQPDPEELTYKAPIQGLPNLDVIPSSILLFRTEDTISTKGDRERILNRYIEAHEDFFNSYDYIIFDTNPSLSFINRNAFLVADSIMLSTDVSVHGLSGAEVFCELWDEKRAELNIQRDNIAGLIISNIDERSNFAKSLEEYAMKNKSFGAQELVLKTVIHTTVKLKETGIHNKPINLLYPNSKAAKEYRELVKEMRKDGIV